VERTIMTFAVRAPKKNHPATPCTKIRTPLSNWNPSDHKQWWATGIVNQKAPTPDTR
jgi:hypothetical protein